MHLRVVGGHGIAGGVEADVVEDVVVAQARQLVTDLSPFVSSRATIMANDAGNSIVVTDTQANIRHLAEIIKAIDGSAEDVTEFPSSSISSLRRAEPLMDSSSRFAASSSRSISDSRP